ncbi:transcription antitermination factor NusB, partial [Enterococcus faecium]
NEAVELSKKYSDDRSRKFVNGVLSNGMKEIYSEA